MAKIIARIGGTLVILLAWLIYTLLSFDTNQPGTATWATKASFSVCLVAIGLLWTVGW